MRIKSTVCLVVGTDQDNADWNARTIIKMHIKEMIFSSKDYDSIKIKNSIC